MSGDATVFPVERLDLRFVQKPWAFAETKRAAIDAHFAELQRAKPAIWNGRVLLMHRQVVSEGTLRGEYLETDFASFTAWRHWGWPAAGVRNCFAAAALASADGAILLGRMAAHTANTGQVYFPCGTPDRSDVAGDRVDLERSVARELKEETGLDLAALTVDPGWTAVVVPGEIAMVKTLRSAETAQALRARIVDFLGRETQPELDEIVIVRGMDDVTPAMPLFVTAFLERFFAA